MNSTSIVRVKGQLPALEQYGVAVKYFTGYTNLAPHPHEVDALLVSFTVRGRGRHWMNDAVYPELPGCLGITHYGEVHSIVTDEEGMDVYNLYLDPRTRPLPPVPVEFNNMLNMLFASRKEFRHRFNRSIHLHFTDLFLPLHCLQVMDREMQQPTAGSAAVIDAMLRVFLIASCRNAMEEGIVPSLSNESPPPAWVLDTCRYLDENYQEHIALDLLAGRVHISKGYLCRAFKKQTGLSVVQYLTERRIQAAMQLLQNTDDKILSVSLDAGFGDLSHFNRLFKKLIGVSPSAYRRKYRPVI